MTEYLEGPRLKLDRADKHIHELDEALDDFIATKPYRVTYKLNADKTFYECRIYHDGRQPPVEIGILVGEIVYQIRSALDHIIFEFSAPKILQIAGREAQLKAIEAPQFPILSKRNEREHRRRLQFVDQMVWDAVERYQPYDRTHCPDPTQHPLTLLNRLSNLDKHRVILVTVGAVGLKPGEGLTPGVEMRRGGRLDDGEIAAWVPVHLNPKQHFGPNLTADILFRRRDGLFGTVSHVGQIYDFVRTEMLPHFSNIAAQLGGSAE